MRLFRREMTSSPPLTVYAAVESIKRSLSELCSVEDQLQLPSSFENPRKFCGYARRLQLILNQLLCSSSPPDDFPASLQTALRGIACDLGRALETVSIYSSRSKIFVLINCLELCESLQETTIAIGQWIALMNFVPHENPNLLKKISDLSREMKQAQFSVTHNEERAHCTLNKEGQGRPSTKAVQSAVIMDLARALGVEPDNHTELIDQIKLSSEDLCNSKKVSERRILAALEKMMNSWSVERRIVSGRLDFDHGDEAHMLPFTNFICPLTKEVMTDPVDLETSQTYERSAIEYWFKRCIEDIRDPTCPVTGTVLKSLELKTNIGLAGAIEEWVNRNVEIQMKSAVKVLSDEKRLLQDVERVLDIIYRISEEHPVSRYKIRNAKIVLSIVELLKNSSKDIKSHCRSKALMVLVSMAKDEESKKRMLEEGVTRFAIHGLIGSSEKEREYAVKLLLEFTNDDACCIKIASEKGALVLLSSMAGNREHPSLSNLAEEVLCHLGEVKENIQQLAAAGRFEPLLRRLHQGTDEERTEMISLVGGMALTNNSKEQIARHSGKMLVDFLKKTQARSPSLQALFNLSGFDDNSTILVAVGLLPALAEVLFENNNAELEVMGDKELAAAIIANIVSNPGHWELATANKNGDKMQSESVVHLFLRLISVVSSQCQASILRILCGLLSSPQASDLVASSVNSGEGIKIIIPFLQHPEAEHRIYAFKITRLLSERFGQNLVSELRLSNKLLVFKEKLLDDKSTDEERSDAASILSNLSFAEDEVKAIFEPNFMKWSALALKNLCRSTNGNTLRPTSGLLEGLLGLLLPFTRSLDPLTLAAVREHQLMTIFCEQLGLASKPRVKQLLALGLRNLSKCGRSLAAADSEPSSRSGFCSSFIFMCGVSSSNPYSCPIHNIPCDAYSQLCLLKSSCIRPLMDLLLDNDTSVQIASLEALSTLFSDTSSCSKRGIDELEQSGMVDAVISLFIEARPGEIQERAVWVTEKILRVESSTHQHSLDQSLVRALVEAFKHGNSNTKRLAQDALTNLKQISGLSGKPSTGFR